ncbi:hypothetical protein FIBSPDRAFT_1052639 [Athelia psychrophila]|uniref:Uncharacterized protein n=1 Tax=Athelia psychrophila TaxID=1759441 RepID=A0A165WYI8_9AGAM|nr:hypothetical protein FIBSPDRAFT_1052639 [Fibularhizoctonia sp. CBS 109695]
MIPSTCPQCRTAVDALFVTDEDTGYMQKFFIQACVSDLVCGTKQPDFVLSGTLRTPRNARQTREASHLEQCRRTWGSLRRSICNTAEGDCFRGLWAHTVATSLLLHRDLVDVLPHWGLVRTEDAWLALREWGYFDGADNQLVLQYSISRYHEFLDLAHFGHRSGLAHSFAIQEPVHEGYIQLRRPSHDDKVEEGHLVCSFDEICRARSLHSYVLYMHRVRLLPGDHTSEKLSFKIKHRGHQPALLIAPNNPVSSAPRTLRTATLPSRPTPL